MKAPNCSIAQIDSEYWVTVFGMQVYPTENNKVDLKNGTPFYFRNDAFYSINQATCLKPRYFPFNMACEIIRAFIEQDMENEQRVSKLFKPD